MNSVSEVYPLQKQITPGSIRYFFISRGRSKIVKAVEYVYVERFKGRSLYNLGFGNYDLELDTLLDDQVSNNGDQYKVFNTVLSSIPIFLEARKKAIITVEGSDSIPEFIKRCKNSCKKNCNPNFCKKAGQRIRIYCAFIDRHFDQLRKSYDFWGKQGFGGQNIIEHYRLGKPYVSLFFMKKNANFK